MCLANDSERRANSIDARTRSRERGHVLEWATCWMRRLALHRGRSIEETSLTLCRSHSRRLRSGQGRSRRMLYQRKHLHASIHSSASVNRRRFTDSERCGRQEESGNTRSAHESASGSEIGRFAPGMCSSGRKGRGGR